MSAFDRVKQRMSGKHDFTLASLQGDLIWTLDDEAVRKISEKCWSRAAALNAYSTLFNYARRNRELLRKQCQITESNHLSTQSRSTSPELRDTEAHNIVSHVSTQTSHNRNDACTNTNPSVTVSHASTQAVYPQSSVEVQTEMRKIVEKCAQTDVTPTEGMAVQTCMIEAADIAIQTSEPAVCTSAVSSVKERSMQTSPIVSVQASVQTTKDVSLPGTSASNETDTENNGVYYHPNHSKRKGGKKIYNRPQDRNWRKCSKQSFRSGRSGYKQNYQRYNHAHQAYDTRCYNPGYSNNYHDYNNWHHSPTQRQYWDEWYWTLTTGIGEILSCILPTW